MLNVLKKKILKFEYNDISIINQIFNFTVLLNMKVVLEKPNKSTTVHYRNVSTVKTTVIR